jgi:hypothetical protein
MAIQRIVSVVKAHFRSEPKCAHKKVATAVGWKFIPTGARVLQLPVSRAKPVFSKRYSRRFRFLNQEMLDASILSILSLSQRSFIQHDEAGVPLKSNKTLTGSDISTDNHTHSAFVSIHIISFLPLHDGTS